jgi:hypothetical protein
MAGTVIEKDWGESEVLWIGTLNSEKERLDVVAQRGGGHQNIAATKIHIVFVMVKLEVFFFGASMLCLHILKYLSSTDGS